jgi:hypothetical protein
VDAGAVRASLQRETAGRVRLRCKMRDVLLRLLGGIDVNVRVPTTSIA